MVSIKKIARIIAIGASLIVGMFLLLLFIADIYINANKESILKYISLELKDKLRGHVTVGNLEISIWRHFPSIDFQLTDFTLSDTVYNKPIIAAQTLATSFNIFRLITSKKSVKNIIIENGAFRLFTDSFGYSNKYLLELKRKDTTVNKKQTSTSLEIEDVSISELAVTIEDKLANKEISFVVNDLRASVNQSGQLMKIIMDEKISMKKGLGFNLEKGAYLENQVLEANWKLQMDNGTKTLSFAKTKLKINQHPYEISGSFSFTDDPKFKINFHTQDLLFDNAKAIVTNAILQKLKLVQLKKPLTVDGYIDGSLLPNREPLVNIDWKTEGNTLITAVTSFTNCSFAGNFMNSVNKDSAHNDPNSRITFSTFNGNWGGISLSGKNITITNLLEPQLHFDFHSDCTFEALDDRFALKEISFVNGQADLHLFYDGPITKDKSMFQDMEGQMNVKNGTILFVPRKITLINCNGNISFYKDSISVGKFSCNYLKNKFDIEVSGTNIRRKSVVGDISQEAIIKCYVRSPYINLEDFKCLFDEKSQRAKGKMPVESFRAVAGKLDDALINSVIGIYVKSDGVKYQNLEAENFDADIRFEPRYWKMAKISLNLAGGSIVASGQIVHTANSNHQAALKVKINNVDVKKLLFGFDNFGQDAVTYEHLNGNFSADASLNAGINRLGKIIPASLFGTLNFSLKNGSLVNFPGLMNIKTFVFKNRDMSNVRFAELKNKLDIKGDNVYVNRMEIQSSVFRLFLEGNYGLAGKNTDLLIQVPLSNLSNGSFSDSSSIKNNGTQSKVGASIWLRSENTSDGKIDVKLTLRKKLKNKK